MRKELAFFVTVILTGVIALVAAQTPQKLAFEVASIKPNRSEDPRISVDADHGNVLASNVSLTILLRFAFDRRLPVNEILRGAFLFSAPTALQVTGGPDWMNKERFDIEAKPPEGHAVAQPEMQLMMQSLLEDRFQLKFHREMRDAPTYNLIVVKAGKLKVSPDKNPAAQGLPPLKSGQLTAFGGAPTPGVRNMTMYGNAIDLARLLPALENWAGRPITDRTNFKGLFDVFLQFSPQQFSPVSTPDPSGASIFTALQEELGLKLESSRGPVEVLVIDSLQRPSEN